ncbi:efflux RND transporter periplasmic adaptor subunit [Thiomicrospira microaerophila]|uniref:efflux RND transporter periplasmic adaptor subunit n=1 Tax=Thiomicrospira microaerophila TaxID=406020 RepID=UPI0005C87CA1|nr:efflux RND transporter periplasmic adaptor subunit [Thiomicrospira microaerophila]
MLSLAVFSVYATPASYIGVVYPDQDLALSLGVSGIAQKVHVKPGTFVHAGDLLLELKNTEQQLEVARRLVLLNDQTEINSLQQRLAIIDEQYRSALRLFETTRSISRDELNQLKLEKITLEGRIEQLKLEKERQRIEHLLALEDLSARKLNAPVQGIIVQVEISAGEWVKPGEPIIKLVDISNTYVKLNLPDRLARRLQLNQTVDVQVDEAGQRQGVLTYIAPIADAASGLVELRISLDNTDQVIRPGSKAQVAF